MKLKLERVKVHRNKLYETESFIITAGNYTQYVCGQSVALKTNGLYWLTTTPNAGVEVALSRKMTLDVSAAYNPWTFKDDKKMRFWLVQPELKYWLCEKFEGHFVGIHDTEPSIMAVSIKNSTTGIWQEEVSHTATTGFYLPIGTWKLKSV